MNEMSWIEKIRNESALSQGDAERLEQGLMDSDSLGKMVQSLPDDVPSMAWRSALNEKLLAASPRRRPSVWRWPSLIALGAAAALTSIFFLSRPPEILAPEQSMGPEAMLVAEHRESVAALEVSSVGLGMEESKSVATGHPDWNESDLEPL